MEKGEVQVLLQKFINGSISREEDLQLQNWIADASDSDREEVLLEYETMVMIMQTGEADGLLFDKIKRRIQDIEKKDEVGVVYKMFSWQRVAVAVAVMGFVIWSLVFLVGQDGDRNGSLRQAQTDPSINPGQDVKAPEVNRAMIELADGRKVYLDSVGIGSLANVSGAEVMKMADGKIVYRENVNGENVNGEIVYNTLTNPRGSKVIDITLSDGSRVWLNAGSSLRYPVVFNNDKREVELMGEGYFEVNSVNRESSIVKGDPSEAARTKGGKIPFFVRSGAVVTEVLGTHFNVNAYEDEGEIKVTLLEGSVNVKPPALKGEDGKTAKGVILKPGQQARLMSNELSVMSGVDTEEVMAWKNGMFQMNNTDIRNIMRQVSRWYDVEVVYEKGLSNVYITGKVPRSTSLSNVLKVFEYSGLRFSIEGRKIMVME